MARKRLIKPEFFRHGALYDLEAETKLPVRLAFAGLWTVADRAGRFVWKPRELKLEVLPYDPVDFGEVLAALERGGFVRRYEVDGRTYGVVPRFTEHQTFHVREAASTLPAPPWADPDDAEDAPKKGPARAKAVPSTVQGSEKAVPSTPVTVTGTVAVTGTGTDRTASAAVASIPDGEPDLFPPAAIPDHSPPSKPAVPAAGGKGGGQGRGKAADEPKYPHYPPEACNALYAVWESRVGSFKYSRFRAETAPLFDRPGGRYGADVLDGALKIAVEVLKHRAEEQERPFDWERFTPAVWVGRIAYWVQCWEKVQADPTHYTTLMPTRGARIAA